MNDGFFKLHVMEQLLVRCAPLSDNMIREFTQNRKERIEELQNFIDIVEGLDTPLSISKLSELSGIPREQLETLEQQGIMNMKGILK